MSHWRRRAVPSPIQGGEVRRAAPALYWLTFEGHLPRSCATCPFQEGVEGVPEAVLCQIDAANPRVRAMSPRACSFAEWQARARGELAGLFRRLMPTDAELAEIAAREAGAESALLIVQAVRPLPPPEDAPG